VVISNERSPKDPERAIVNVAGTIAPASTSSANVPETSTWGPPPSPPRPPPKPPRRPP